MTDALTDEDAADPEDERTAVTRRARELLERTAMTPEEREAHEERCERNRIDAILHPRIEERRAPVATIEDRAARSEANRLARVVGAPPSPSRPPPVQWKEFRAYANGVEKAVGKIWAELRQRHESADGRTAGIETRLAQVEARLAALEAKQG